MRTLPHGEYIINQQGSTRTLTGTIDINEYGYWVTNDTGLLLHVAHGSLLSIEPATPAVTPTARTAREKLQARAGR